MLITVAIPVYNRESMIQSVVRSALDQHLEPSAELEILVVDNCSTDRTAERVRSITDARVRLVRNDRNLGMFGNFNRCRELARGEFVRYLCSDDSLPADVLQQEVDLLRKHPSAVLLNTRGRVTGATDGARIGAHFPDGLIDGRRATLEALQLLAEGRNAFNFPSGILIRSSAAVGTRFDESLLGLADVDYWLQILVHGQLLSSTRTGCFVTEHPGRASYELFFAGDFLSGQIKLIRRWAARLEIDAEISYGLGTLLAGRCGYYMMKCLFAGRLDGFRAHLRIAGSEGYGSYRILSGALLMVRRRLAGR